MPPFQPPLDPTEVDAAFPRRYLHIDVLKSGGQGSVFRVLAGPAHSSSDGTPIALKVYFADQLEERTQREVDALRRIQSAVVVSLVDTGRVTLRNLPCIWIETAFVEGECLGPIISRGPIELETVAAIAHDIARALEVLWVHRIVHRDVKPDNIILRPDGHAVLIDLGVARHTALESLTSYGKTWGTEGYLSPEQGRALRSLTCKSDVFCLGIVIQEALLGRHPTARRQVQLAAGGPVTSTLRQGLPVAFNALVDRMVSRDPIRRPTPAEIATSMRPFVK